MVSEKYSLHACQQSYRLQVGVNWLGLKRSVAGLHGLGDMAAHLLWQLEGGILALLDTDLGLVVVLEPLAEWSHIDLASGENRPMIAKSSSNTWTMQPFTRVFVRTNSLLDALYTTSNTLVLRVMAVKVLHPAIRL